MLFNKKELKRLDRHISSLTNLPKLKIAEKQFTLSNKVKFSGVGLHSGKKINMTLHPSDENTGIFFRLRDKHGLTSDIKATYNNVQHLKMKMVNVFQQQSISYHPFTLLILIT